jgi:c-di-AMP phosphodiesterase-like protein
MIERMFYYAAFASLVLLGITAFALRKQMFREKELKNYMIDYTSSIENISVNSFFNFPMPICIINSEGKIFWFNSKFKEMSGNEETDIDNIRDFIADFPLKSVSENKDGTVNNIEVSSSNKNYNIIFNILENGRFGEGKSYVLYWMEVTSYINLKNKYNDERPIAMLVQIDNYDEISETLDKGEKSAMTAEVEKILNKYASEMNGFVLKYDTYRFL